MSNALKDRWQEVNTVLDLIYELPTQEQFLACERYCKNDPCLLSAVRHLLASEQQAPAYLDSPALAFNTDYVDSSGRGKVAPVAKNQWTNLEGKQFGAFRLCEKIGEGGMGLVYRAERVKGDFAQQVAIKILSRKSGSDNFARERFQREQQLLASLNHPNIAQLFDGGVDEDGSAYFIMEYVAGTPIDKYCREHTLNLTQILQLITTVANTLQFAHGQLIIHRDIKASNILVSDRGDIKLLDFGIAKFVDARNALELTCTGEQILTPGSAAPEQLLNKDISVATDIYQLGLMAHELIIGCKVHQGRAQSLAHLIHLVCKCEVPTPSHTLSQQFSSAPREEQRRLHALHKKVKGDVDAILLKMLRTDPRDRYASMSAVIEDINAYFAKRPLQARQISLGYQGKKFVQRNWRVLSVSVCIIALSITYFTNFARQARKTEAALAESVLSQKKAEEVSNFLLNIFTAADPYNLGADKISARTLLDQGHQRAEKDLATTPLLKANMLMKLGEINQHLGDYSASLQLFEQALAIHTQILPPDHLSIATNLQLLGSTQEFLGDYDAALENFEAALVVFNKYDKAKNLDEDTVLNLVNEIGELQFKMGFLNKAQRKFEKVIQHFRQRGIKKHRILAIGLNNLSIVYHRQSQFTASKTAMLEAIAINESLFGESHPRIANSLVNLAVKMIDWETLDEAQTLLIRALQLQEKYLGPTHTDTLRSKLQLGFLYHKQGKLNEAEALLQEIVQAYHEHEGDDVNLAMSYYRLAEVQIDARNYIEAENNFAKMKFLFEELTISDTYYARGIAGQARLALAQDKFIQAEALFTSALKRLPESSIRSTITQLGFAQLMLRTARAEEALTLARKALNFRLTHLPYDHNLILEAKICILIAQLQLHEKSKDKNSNWLHLRDELSGIYFRLKKERPPHDDYLALAEDALASVH